jgi:hypothetical protein
VCGWNLNPGIADSARDRGEIKATTNATWATHTAASLASDSGESSILKSAIEAAAKSVTIKTDCFGDR